MPRQATLSLQITYSAGTYSTAEFSYENFTKLTAQTVGTHRSFGTLRRLMAQTQSGHTDD